MSEIEEWTVDVQHIGSTSVPRLMAKPVIDIGIAVGAEDRLIRLYRYSRSMDTNLDEGMIILGTII